MDQQENQLRQNQEMNEQIEDIHRQAKEIEEQQE